MNACMSSPSLASWPSTAGGAVPFVAGEDADRRQRGGLDAGRRVQPFEQLGVEVHRLLFFVTAQRRRQPEGDQVVHLDSGVGGLQVLQAADEQSGAEQQQEAERDLRGDEPLAQEERPTGARHGADRVLQRRPLIGLARAKRGQQAKHDARDAASART